MQRDIGKLTRKQQAENTRKKLMDTIMELMNTTGYHELTIDQICQKAGVSKGTFYHYFQSKREILLHICQAANDRIIAQLSFDETRSARYLFDQYLCTLVEMTYAEGYAGEARMLIALLTSGAKETYNSIRPQTDYVIRIFRHGQARGEIPPSLDVDALNELITGAIQGFVARWSIAHGETDLLAQLQTAFAPIWQMVSLCSASR